MRIEINREECPNYPAEVTDCMHCVERFINYPVPYERHCFRVVESGDLSEVSILILAGAEPVAVGVGPEQRYPLSQSDWLS